MWLPVTEGEQENSACMRLRGGLRVAVPRTRLKAAAVPPLPVQRACSPVLAPTQGHQTKSSTWRTLHAPTF